jgi:hypothetical protein
MKKLLSTIRKILRQTGYKKTLFPVGAFGGMQVSVHVGCRHTVVLVERIVLPCSVQIGGASRPLPSLRDAAEVFRRMRRSLDALGGNLSQTTLVLPGGGTIPVPKTFRDWANRKGLQIEVVTDALPKRLLRRINDNSSRRAIPEQFADIFDALG